MRACLSVASSQNCPRKFDTSLACTPGEATEWFRQIGTVTVDNDRHSNLNLDLSSSDSDCAVSPRFGRQQADAGAEGMHGQEVDQVIWERFRQSIRVDPISLADRRAVTTDPARTLGNLPAHSHYLNIQNIPTKTYVDNSPAAEEAGAAAAGSNAAPGKGKAGGGGGVQGLKEKRDQVRELCVHTNVDDYRLLRNSSSGSGVSAHILTAS